MQYTAKQLRRAHLDAMLTEWRRPVRAETDVDRITAYFDAVGWDWALERAGVDTYSEAAREEHGDLLNWCGIGVAFAGLQVGDYLEEGQCVPVRLDPAIAELVLPSTYRADIDAGDKAKWDEAGYEPPEEPDEIAPGDIVCVVTGAGKRYGDHFAMVVEVHGDELATVEANAWGERGGVTTGRGVIYTGPSLAGPTRTVGDVRRVIRLDERHFESSF